jgi:hypothetical protein
MKKLLTIITIALILGGCTNVTSSGNVQSEKPTADTVKTKKTLLLEFPGDLNLSSDSLPIRGHLVNLVTKTSQKDSAMFILFHLKLGDLSKQVDEDPNGFFSGMLSYLMGDLGANFQYKSDFKCSGISGKNFDIILPIEAIETTAKGRTLLVDDQAYIWFAISRSADSKKKVDRFINSVKLE